MATPVFGLLRLCLGRPFGARFWRHAKRLRRGEGGRGARTQAASRWRRRSSVKWVVGADWR